MMVDLLSTPSTAGTTPLKDNVRNYKEALIFIKLAAAAVITGLLIVATPVPAQATDYDLNNIKLAAWPNVVHKAGKASITKKELGWDWKKLQPTTWITLSNGNRVNSMTAYWNCKVGQMYPECSKNTHGQVIGK